MVDQICRNIYASLFANFAGLPGLTADHEQYEPILSDPSTPNTPFDDYRLIKKDFDDEIVVHSSPNDYPANYAIALFDTLTTIVHYSLIESTSSAIPFLLMRTSLSNSSLTTYYNHHSSYNPSSIHMSKQNDSAPGLSLNSMVGSALSVIPGTRGATEFMSNFIGKVFTTTDNANSSNVS